MGWELAHGEYARGKGDPQEGIDLVAEVKMPTLQTERLIPITQTETEVPATLFIDHTDPGLTIDWKSMQSGNQVQEMSFNVLLSGSAVLDVRRYRKVSVLIYPSATPKEPEGEPYLLMGKYDNIFANPFMVPRDGNAHTFDIVGPDLMMWFWGLTSYPTETVRLYLYLTS